MPQIFFLMANLSLDWCTFVFAKNEWDLLVIIQVSVLLDPLHHHVDQPVLHGLTTFTSPSSPPARLLESDRPEELVCQQTISLSLSLWIMQWSFTTWRAPLLPRRLLLQLQEVPCSGSPSRVGNMLDCCQSRFLKLLFVKLQLFSPPQDRSKAGHS